MNKTQKRLDALRYAAGEGEDRQPTIGVCRPLEKAGLIIWVGSYGRGWGKVENILCKRPWRITAKGETLLNLWK